MTYSISIHAPREGSDMRTHKNGRICAKFLSTLPARGATRPRGGGLPAYGHFYPRSPRGERRRPGAGRPGTQDFYPRSPRGERRRRGRPPGSPGQNFYPRSPRGERPAARPERPAADNISIHAPREGSDTGDARTVDRRPHFYPRSPRGERQRFFLFGDTPVLISIHAPREGSDSTVWRACPIPMRFLSTLPARGATRPSPSCWMTTPYFYPRSPRGERPLLASASRMKSIFLSTLPARGATRLRPVNKSGYPSFLSTLPARGATVGPGTPHTPLGYFYPRSPRGERPDADGHQVTVVEFLSTLPARGATLPPWRR